MLTKLGRGCNIGTQTFTKELENIIKKQSELKNTVTEMKNSVH